MKFSKFKVVSIVKVRFDEVFFGDLQTPEHLTGSLNNNLTTFVF